MAKPKNSISLEERKKMITQKKYKRFTPAPIETESALDVVLSMAVDSLKAGRPATYPDTDEGFDSFRQTTIDYFSFIRESNEKEHDKKLIADVEGLCTYLGITRVTLWTYEQNRPGRWSDFIKQAKNAIVAIKKQLIFNQQIPPIVGIFDLVNNTDYYRNSSEFKLEVGAAPKKEASKTLPILKEDQDDNVIDMEIPMIDQK